MEEALRVEEESNLLELERKKVEREEEELMAYLLNEELKKN